MVAWIINVETLRFIYVSPSFEKLRGFTASEVMAGNLTDSLEPRQTGVAHTQVAGDSD